MAKAKLTEDKKILTDSRIRGIKPVVGKQIDLPDNLVEGLRLRVSGRSKTFAMRLRVDGNVRTITLGQFGDEPGQLGLADARIKGEALRKAARNGDAIPSPATASRSKPTRNSLRSYVETFMEEYPTGRTIKRPEAMRWMFQKYVVATLGDRDVAKITKIELRDFLRTIATTNGVTTARRVGALLKRLFKFAAEEDVIEIDPAATLKLPGRENERRRTLNNDEIKALWLATDPATKSDERNKAGRLRTHASSQPWGSYFRLLLLLGQRRSEVAQMRWSDLDLKDPAAATWMLSAEDTKSTRAHVVPLPPLVVEILQAIPRFTILDAEGNDVPCNWVLTTSGRAPIADFSKPKGWLDADMAKHLDDLPPWVVHDLRRTFSTGLARLRVQPHIRSRCLNHAPVGLDRNYDQWDYIDEKREAMEAWARDVVRIVEEREGDNVVALHG